MTVAHPAMPVTNPRFPYDRWHAALPVLREQYATQKPFPHVHLADFLDGAVSRQLSTEFADPAQGPWIHYKHYNENHLGLTQRAALPSSMGAVVDELNSAAFVAWLTALTGIPELVADPSLEGGGLHQSGPGGFLNVHADFTTHRHHTHWRRRVNVIVYLNPDWRPEWGGALEFWDQGMQHSVVRVPPLANHAVIFNTDERSYHGFPDPLRCPPGVMRKSLALYYYTVERDRRVVSRSTSYQARPGDGRLKGALIWADTQAVRLYSKVKSAFGLSDDFASRTLAAFHRRRRRE